MERRKITYRTFGIWAYPNDLEKICQQKFHLFASMTCSKMRIGNIPPSGYSVVSFGGQLGSQALLSLSSKRREIPPELSGLSIVPKSNNMLDSSSLVGGPDCERSLRLMKKARSRMGNGKVSKKVYRKDEGTSQKT
jgi:hypothetical protein